MRYIKGCIIRKNTKKLRSSLRELGYSWIMRVQDSNCIITHPEIYKFMEQKERAAKAWIDKGWIDCGINEDLFFALAAFTCYSNLNQYLIVTDATGDKWVKCKESNFKPDETCLMWRKATIDEIVEHFKDK